MEWGTLILLLVVMYGTVLQASVQGVNMPDYIKICSRNDPKIGECVKNSVNTLRPYLKQGIKELNVPSMEPLYIGDLNILEEGSSSINVKVKKLNIRGASNFEIKKIKSTDNAKRFDFELLLPELLGDGLYYINGQILALHIKGNGPFTGNFTNFVALVKVVFDTKLFNDVEYIFVKELTVKIRTGKGSVNLQNLFNGEKALGDVINDTINKNFEVFTNEVIGPIERALEKKFISIANTILENFSYNELFPL